MRITVCYLIVLPTLHNRITETRTNTSHREPLRVELAEHYGNPYPRMYYAQPGTIYKSGNRGKSKVQPVYMHSYYDGGDFGIDSNQGAESLSDGSPADS